MEQNNQSMPFPPTETAPEQPFPPTDAGPAPEQPDPQFKKSRRPAGKSHGFREHTLKDWVLLALFVAIIVLLGLTPVGMIPLGFINVTILAVPVVVGTLLLGWQDGLVLGAAFGGVSFASALMKPSSLVATLMGVSPIYVFLLCILPRLCVPLAAWGVNCFFEKRSGSPTADYLTSSICGCLFNLLTFLVVPGWFRDAGMSDALSTTLTALIGFAVNIAIGYGMFRLLGMKGKATAVSAVAGSLTNTVLYLGMMLLFYIIAGIDSAKVLALIGGTALLAGAAEAAVAGILCTPILSALRRLK